jgi:hypothetical protein
MLCLTDQCHGLFYQSEYNLYVLIIILNSDTCFGNFIPSSGVVYTESQILVQLFL